MSTVIATALSISAISVSILDLAQGDRRLDELGEAPASTLA
jgi:hypothetical protein